MSLIISLNFVNKNKLFPEIEKKIEKKDNILRINFLRRVQMKSTIIYSFLNSVRKSFSCNNAI